MNNVGPPVRRRGGLKPGGGEVSVGNRAFFGGGTPSYGEERNKVCQNIKGKEDEITGN